MPTWTVGQEQQSNNINIIRTSNENTLAGIYGKAQIIVFIFDAYIAHTHTNGASVFTK